ncbi:MAG: Stp1/IreP family PP2C-type Ser/Thr phosphatase [Chitinophagaceae bacterium]|nr:Stp1/IreP family PP2C-type Ser/Thr phosphatase [Anaerolineae bacterium]
MDLFRRIFGKTGEEAPEKAQASKTIETNAIQSREVISDAIDASTRPVNPIDTGQLPERRMAMDGATRPLAPEKVISKQNEHMTFGQSTDVGLVRSNNQDAALTLFFTSRSSDERADFGLFVVADGMGGHQHGEKASAIATRIVASQVTNNIYLPILSNSTSERPPITEALIAAVQKANLEVIRYVEEGGTTVTAAAVIGDLAYFAHVGDSRAYLITKDGMEQVTRDHSLVQRLIELDQLTKEESMEHPQRNVLYRALGQNEVLEVDTLTRRLPPNSKLLLCSDGLWNYVEEKDIFETVMNNVDPQQACDKLVAMANTNGGLDNVTAILLKISN